VGLPSWLPAVQSGGESVSRCPESSARGRYADLCPPGRPPRRTGTEVQLPKAGTWHGRLVQVLPMKPGNYALGSPQSRAAARFLLSERKTSKTNESRWNLDGLAETIRAARMRLQAGGVPVSLPASEAGQQGDGGGRLDCLSQRMRMARERATRAQGPETML